MKKKKCGKPNTQICVFVPDNEKKDFIWHKVI